MLAQQYKLYQKYSKVRKTVIDLKQKMNTTSLYAQINSLRLIS